MPLLSKFFFSTFCEDYFGVLTAFNYSILILVTHEISPVRVVTHECEKYCNYSLMLWV